MYWTMEKIDVLTEEELSEIERRTERLMSIWKIQNLRGNAAIFHDDQHIGEQRRELNALKHPSVDVEGLMAFRQKAVVDSLTGNMLVHPLTTPVIEVDENNRRARSVWWSMGVEGLSKHREEPVAIVSLGMVPGVEIVEDGAWKILWGVWQRTTKNEYHAGWVKSMIPTNTRPELTPEEDRAGFGRYAYQENEVRQAIPQPPKKDTWEKYPDEMDKTWLEG
ncbi:hypothetical protein [Laedolimicola ammoniilytica]|uniref:SnoaL-like domain-containing protein n=1 Tax=Laedolimicola ammoniilytica TaxID=2981771 RepID=A0ABT2RZF1_9FIRM|nr:hypothetical protein [Laedolimicola ammoniilytica]MCU6697709.1 hypothetical protein [Laedolimicola ammoniilytica]SCH54051.1 Uncharacterised protein [uncultured Clostridium sp.]SCI42069.1 Uncharacterised protein [uncultured Clostridium sp.]